LKLQDYDFTLQHIPEKANTKVDILSRKDQVNTKEDNKNVQLLKEKLWTRRTTVEVMMLRRTTIADDLEIMKEIKKTTLRNRKWSKHWKKMMDYHGKKIGLYIWKEEYMLQTTRNSKKRFYKRIMT